MCHICKGVDASYLSKYAFACLMEDAMVRFVPLVVAAILISAPFVQAQNADFRTSPSRSSSRCRPAAASTPSRALAERLHQKLGQPFVIENRGGAGGNVGAEAVYAARPTAIP